MGHLVWANKDRASGLEYCTHFWDRAPSPGEVSVYVNEPLQQAIFFASFNSL